MGPFFGKLLSPNSRGSQFAGSGREPENPVLKHPGGRFDSGRQRGLADTLAEKVIPSGLAGNLNHWKSSYGVYFAPVEDVGHRSLPKIGPSGMIEADYPDSNQVGPV